jgi:predicted nucleic acid-binding protein
LKRDAFRVIGLTRETAQRAGALLEKAGMPSRHAVDAFVVSTALEFDSALIATGDVEDLRQLSASYRQITLMQI